MNNNKGIQRLQRGFGTLLRGFALRPGKGAGAGVEIGNAISDHQKYGMSGVRCATIVKEAFIRSPRETALMQKTSRIFWTQCKRAI